MTWMKSTMYKSLEHTVHSQCWSPTPKESQQHLADWLNRFSEPLQFIFRGLLCSRTSLGGGGIIDHVRSMREGGIHPVQVLSGGGRRGQGILTRWLYPLPHQSRFGEGRDGRGEERKGTLTR